MPARRFEVARGAECSDSTFLITLHGSKSLEVVKFKIPCRSEQLPISSQQPTTRYFIKIISEMYDSDCSVWKGLKGKCDVELVKDDMYCCVLICEISFHLVRWKEVGLQLAMRNIDLDVIDAKNLEYYEKAFEMLLKWLRSCNTLPNLRMLIKGLNSVGYSLDESSHWTTSYNTVTPKTMDATFMMHVADYIQRHWKFVACILGEERYIMDVVKHDSDNSHEQAYYMLLQWGRHCPLDEKAYMRLYNSIHCIHEHLPLLDYLKVALSTFLV